MQLTEMALKAAGPPTQNGWYWAKFEVAGRTGEMVLVENGAALSVTSGSWALKSYHDFHEPAWFGPFLQEMF